MHEAFPRHANFLKEHPASFVGVRVHGFRFRGVEAQRWGAEYLRDTGEGGLGIALGKLLLEFNESAANFAGMAKPVGIFQIETQGCFGIGVEGASRHEVLAGACEVLPLKASLEILSGLFWCKVLQCHARLNPRQSLNKTVAKVNPTGPELSPSLTT